MAVVDELAGVRWRRGLACRMPRLWLDVPRPGALGLLSDGDVVVPPRARVLATPIAANLAGLTAGRALRVPYGQPFQLGAGAVELLASGASLGGAVARLHAKQQTLLVVGAVATEPLPSCAPLELREADVLVIDASHAEATLLSAAEVQSHLRTALAAPAQVWLLQEPLRALDLLLWADGAARIAPSLRQLLLRAGLPVLAPPPPGRRAEGLLLWPLAQAARLPAAWRDVPQVALAEPDAAIPAAATRLPVSRRLAGDALVRFVRQAACPTVLAWGHGAPALAQRLERLGQVCHVLRIPYQLPLV